MLGAVTVGGREFEAIAEHTRATYLRYSFTKGSAQEVGFLLGAMDLGPGARLLDVGCGPGRHAHPMADAGVEVVGVDISEPFLAAAGEGRWVRADGRLLPFPPASFDAAVSLCQGGFGLLGGSDDALVIGEIARVLRPGGVAAVSAFSSYFAVRHLEAGDTFDPDRGVNHERATVRDEQGTDATFDLWTTCFTPRELRLIAGVAGLTVHALWSVAPGSYQARPPDLEHPEWLVLLGKAPV